MGQDIVGQNFVGQDVAGAISLGQDVSGAGGSGAGSRESLFCSRKVMDKSILITDIKIISVH